MVKMPTVLLLKLEATWFADESVSPVWFPDVFEFLESNEAWHIVSAVCWVFKVSMRLSLILSSAFFNAVRVSVLASVRSVHTILGEGELG